VALIDGEKRSIVEGRWFAGGPNVYLRYPAGFEGQPSRPLIMHLVDISPDQFTVRFSRESRVYRFQRASLDSPHASNQSMKLTAGSFAINF
jgi:hypothetical protein